MVRLSRYHNYPGKGEGYYSIDVYFRNADITDQAAALGYTQEYDRLLPGAESSAREHKLSNRTYLINQRIVAQSLRISVNFEG